MAITEKTVSFTEGSLGEIQRLIGELKLDGWLLYDFHGVNPVAGGVLGLPELSRRFFVFVPARGRPIALTHRIEQQPWQGWIGENRPYLGWQSLEQGLAAVLAGAGTIACEYSPDDAVPYLDRVPGGLLEMIVRTGVRVVSSGELVSAFYSRWGESGLAGHLAAARTLRQIAHDAFRRIGDRLLAAESPTEWELREWVAGAIAERGLAVGGDSIVAVNANAANPHYAPGPDRHAPIRRGDLVLIDLWGKADRDAIYADQTWMGYVGERIPDRIADLWTTIRDARDSAVDFIRSRHAAGQAVAGFEVDDVARRIVTERGHGEVFIHRTGHSIDRQLHGSGPNIDNLETRDTRLLIPGIGFSIEPGVYYPGEVGLRTEIDVYMSDSGPLVTTPQPQREIVLIGG